MKGNNIDVSIFIPEFAGGGVSQVFLKIAKELSKDMDVEIVTAIDNNSMKYEFVGDIDVHTLKSSKVRYSVFKLARYLRDRKPEYLVSAMNQANVVALIASKMSRTPVKNIVSIRNNTSELLKNENNLSSRVLPFFIKRTYRWADEIIPNSRGVARDISEISGIPVKEMKVIHNPVVDSDLQEKASEGVEHRFFKSDKTVILGVGRLHRQKDFKTLIEAFKLLNHKKESRLLILGEGEKRKELENLIQKLNLDKYVDMPGYAENPYKYMKNSTVFVLSSRWEGLPNVLIEAMATGTPVVSTDCLSGPSEILKNGEYGELVPVGDSEKLAKAILSTLENPTEEQKLIRRSNDFNAKKCINQFKELIKT
ncbi:Glycosyltransferase, RfaG family [Methanonatronarchaeum thermophilum]|uniref:Glycosyltransferase, RfaG family n=1 Tax=Methanonatronarchaeum thermophilum TaxID=1927129 RepID=A0A1Y3GDH8_9EURY|nr:glycosyltransferase [Methanonatronarchaeum thermophilum]OUJ19310.1 Glycosyltransferase, RfaG family [Methanonatronarchaeum thermophilum]